MPFSILYRPEMRTLITTQSQGVLSTTKLTCMYVMWLTKVREMAGLAHAGIGSSEQGAPLHCIIELKESQPQSRPNVLYRGFYFYL